MRELYDQSRERVNNTNKSVLAIIHFISSALIYFPSALSLPVAFLISEEDKATGGDFFI